MATGSYSDTFGGGGWGGYGAYLAQKDTRINEQLQARHNTNDNEEAKIFEGCVFWLDGRTRIPEYKLKAMLVRNGGSYEAYDLSRVTHVVADNLALGNKKWQKIRDKGSRRFEVVTSEWVVASVHKGERINESFFVPQAIQTRNDGYGTLLKFVQTPGPNTEPSTPIPETSISHPISSPDRKASNLQLGTDDSDDFVASFFKASRLHFLGRWRERILKQISVLNLLPPNPPFGSADTQTSSSTLLTNFLTGSGAAPTNNEVPSEPRLFMHIDFDAFFVSVALCSRPPEMQMQPVAVAHGSAFTSKSEIASCNYRARRSGVGKGMWLETAKGLCPSLVVLPYDFEGIEKASSALADILTNVTSRVLPMSCDEAYVQLVGDFECRNAKFVAQWIRHEVHKRTRCNVSIGIGPNLFLAKLAGKIAKPSPLEPPRSAPPTPDQTRIEADLEGIFSVPLDRKALEKFLSPIELEEMPGVGIRASSKLMEHNLRNVEDVLKTSSLLQLQKLLGKRNGELLWSFCHGIDLRNGTPDPTDQPQSLLVSVNWGVRLTTEKGVLNFLSQMAAECERRLTASDLTTEDVTLKMLRRAAHAPVDTVKYGGCGECDEFWRRQQNLQKISQKEDLNREIVKLWKTGLCTDFPVISDIRGVSVVLAKLARKGVGSHESSLDIMSKNKRARDPKTPDTHLPKKRTLDFTASAFTKNEGGRELPPEQTSSLSACDSLPAGRESPSLDECKSSFPTTSLSPAPQTPAPPAKMVKGSQETTGPPPAPIVIPTPDPPPPVQKRPPKPKKKAVGGPNAMSKKKGASGPITAFLKKPQVVSLSDSSDDETPAPPKTVCSPIHDSPSVDASAAPAKSTPPVEKSSRPKTPDLPVVKNLRPSIGKKTPDPLSSKQKSELMSQLSAALFQERFYSDSVIALEIVPKFGSNFDDDDFDEVILLAPQRVVTIDLLPQNSRPQQNEQKEQKREEVAALVLKSVNKAQDLIRGTPSLAKKYPIGRPYDHEKCFGTDGELPPLSKTEGRIPECWHCAALHCTQQALVSGQVGRSLFAQQFALALILDAACKLPTPLTLSALFDRCSTFLFGVCFLMAKADDRDLEEGLLCNLLSHCDATNSHTRKAFSQSLESAMAKRGMQSTWLSERVTLLMEGISKIGVECQKFLVGVLSMWTPSKNAS